MAENRLERVPAAACTGAAFAQAAMAEMPTGMPSADDDPRGASQRWLPNAYQPPSSLWDRIEAGMVALQPRLPDTPGQLVSLPWLQASVEATDAPAQLESLLELATVTARIAEHPRHPHELYAMFHVGVLCTGC